MHVLQVRNISELVWQIFSEVSCSALGNHAGDQTSQLRQVKVFAMRSKLTLVNPPRK
uniref:Uncharacterized protein n=1 Tax=Anguilla anguilla TaxID=7936 RepID=A0A0E9WP05_ANGAN